MKDPEVTDSEDLFRMAMQDVKPLQQKVVLAPKVVKAPREAPSEAQLQARLAALGEKKAEPPDYLTLAEVPPVEPRAFLEWRLEGVQELVTGRLRKGHYPPADSLDLHGEYVKRAREMVHNFLTECHGRGHRCVRIVHGRGEKSPEPARLKKYVNAWLQAHPLVNAFVSATPGQGGTGAVFVLIRKSKAARDRNRELHGGAAGDDGESGVGL